MLRLTCFVLSHRLLVVLLWVALALGVGLGILAALIVPFFSMHTGEASATSLAAKGAYRVALDDLGRDGIPAGVLDPIEVIVSGGAGGAAAGRRHRAARAGTRAVPVPVRVLSSGR
ncbi:MAG TPA: hypothetical protein VF223_00225 [Trebonia sp.]